MPFLMLYKSSKSLAISLIKYSFEISSATQRCILTCCLELPDVLHEFFRSVKNIIKFP